MSGLTAVKSHLKSCQTFDYSPPLPFNDMSAPYKKVLLVGATSGNYLSHRLIQALAGLLQKNTPRRAAMLSLSAVEKEDSTCLLVNTMGWSRQRSLMSRNWIRFPNSSTRLSLNILILIASF